MTRRQKVLVTVVLAALVLLYAAGMAGAGRSGDGSLTGRPGGIVGWLGGIVGQPPRAAPQELSSACLSERTLTVQGSCVLTVAGSGRTLRRVALHARDAVTVTARAP